MSRPTAIERVALGSALLDTITPGWADRVNPSRFAISSRLHCVLGQLFNHYAEGERKLFPGAGAADCYQTPEQPLHPAKVHGFFPIDWNDDDAQLQRAWLDAMRVRWTR